MADGRHSLERPSGPALKRMAEVTSILHHPAGNFLCEGSVDQGKQLPAVFVNAYRRCDGGFVIKTQMPFKNRDNELHGSSVVVENFHTDFKIWRSYAVDRR